MLVVCKDGTTIPCQQFRAIDSGVLLFDDAPDGDDDESPEATGFVPVTELRYVLPDDVPPGGPDAQPAGQRGPPAHQPGPGGQVTEQPPREPGPQSEQRGPRSGGPDRHR